MGCMTWLGMCRSGFGTGMATIFLPHRLTREGLVRGGDAGPVGATFPQARSLPKWRAEVSTTLTRNTKKSDSVLFCLQVNHELAGGRRRSDAGVVVGSRGCGTRRTRRRSGKVVRFSKDWFRKEFEGRSLAPTGSTHARRAQDPAERFFRPAFVA